MSARTFPPTCAELPPPPSILIAVPGVEPAVGERVVKNLVAILQLSAGPMVRVETIDPRTRSRFRFAELNGRAWIQETIRTARHAMKEAARGAIVILTPISAQKEAPRDQRGAHACPGFLAGSPLASNSTTSTPSGARTRGRRK